MLGGGVCLNSVMHSGCTEVKDLVRIKEGLQEERIRSRVGQVCRQLATCLRAGWAL